MFLVKAGYVMVRKGGSKVGREGVRPDAYLRKLLFEIILLFERSLILKKLISESMIEVALL